MRDFRRIVLSVVCVLLLVACTACVSKTDTAEKNFSAESKEAAVEEEEETRTTENLSTADVSESDTASIYEGNQENITMAGGSGLDSSAEEASQTAGDNSLQDGEEGTGKAISSDSESDLSSSVGQSASDSLKWEEFYALTGPEKDAYMESYPNLDAFYAWVIEAQSQFTKEHPDNEIGSDGAIDLSKLK